MNTAHVMLAALVEEAELALESHEDHGGGPTHGQTSYCQQQFEQ